MKPCILLDGAFDPLHNGHLAYIRAAAQRFPDHELVVSVCADDDIRAKGREPLFPQETRVEVVRWLKLVDRVIPKTEPTERIIGRLRPDAYIKGHDWEGTLPADILAVCSLMNVQVVYLDTAKNSSSGALRRWALSDAERGLSRLETFMAAQSSAPASVFDRDYFAGTWRADGNVYTYEKRKEIEGRHPELIVECFPKMSVLDVGCGPGYLVRMLKELGVVAGGIDTSRDAVGMALDRSCVLMSVEVVPPDFADVAICREVLEHVPVQEIPAMVCDLFRVAKKFVYITTRFHQGSVFEAETDFETDPTHITCLSKPFLRALCVLNGGTRRADLEAKLDWMNKGRCLVYEVA